MKLAKTADRIALQLHPLMRGSYMREALIRDACDMVERRLDKLEQAMLNAWTIRRR